MGEFEDAKAWSATRQACARASLRRNAGIIREGPSAEAGETPALVRLRVYMDSGVQVPVGHTFSGPELNVTASPRGEVESHRR